MTDHSAIHRTLSISRARRELTSILRRAETVQLTQRGVPVAELAPLGGRLIEEARASTRRASTAIDRALDSIAASNQRIESLERSRARPENAEQESLQGEADAAVSPGVLQQVQEADTGPGITRPHFLTLRERMQRDPEFVLALLSEAQELIRDGDIATASLLLRDMGRDLGQELLQSIRAMKSGQLGRFKSEGL